MLMIARGVGVSMQLAVGDLCQSCQDHQECSGESLGHAMHLRPHDI